MTRIHLQQGILEGTDSDGVHAFLGIPYAAPPTGDLRWRAPEPPQAWTGIRDASSFGAAALQTGGATSDLRVDVRSEDCLFLNVWTTRTDPSAAQPVMVWIHGGGNLGGAGSEDAFDGRVLAAHGVTVVTLNYRLGAFGFLAHPTAGANFAVLDIVAALRWVQDEISAFGGDPGNVTVFGQSAGAWAVRTLLSTPRARGLFHRAVLQSAGFEDYAFAPPPTLDRGHATAAEFFRLLGARDIDTARALPAQEVLAASDALRGTAPPPGQVHTPANLTWAPIADGAVVAHSGFPGWAEGVPVLLGTVTNEARYFVRPDQRPDWDVVRSMARTFAGSDAEQALALARHPARDAYATLDRLFTTAVWTEPAHATAERLARLGRTVYAYTFTRVGPGAQAREDLARHTAEIRYVFGTLEPAQDYDATDAAVSAAVRDAWTGFARTGVPAVHGQAWPTFTPQEPTITEIGNTITSRPWDVDPLMALITSRRGHS